MSYDIPPERRREARRMRSGRLIWTSLTGPDRTGWVSDIGPSSLSFVTPNQRTIRQGSTIHVRERSGDSPLKVIRITPYDERLSLIACRRERPEPATAS